MRDIYAAPYKEPMQTHKNNNGFTDRLTACIDRVGGKRAMATATLISEAQLFRYVNGENILPSDRLVAVAKAANVDAGWLLTGKGSEAGTSSDARPAFRSELMVQIVTLFEELLVEFEKSFNPRQRARAITFLYNALRHEENKRNTQFSPQKFDMLKYLHFLTELRTEEELEILNSAVNMLEYGDEASSRSDTDLQLLKTWCNLIVRGMKGYYSSYPGQVYFERRSGGELEAAAVLELQNLVVNACKLTGKTELEWLDLGCGNGRHMQHIYKHMPNVSVKGLELSPLGYNFCKELMVAEKLPKDSVLQGDMRQLPYASQSFDVIFAHMSLHCLPYIPGSGLGLEEAIHEAHRVLKTGGIAALVFPAGNWRDYSMPRQFMDDALIKLLAERYSFNIISTSITDEHAESTTASGRMLNPMMFSYSSSLWVTLQKR